MFSNSQQLRGPPSSPESLELEEQPDSQKGVKLQKDLFPGSDPSSPIFQTDQQLTVQIGERRFTTTKSTLIGGSRYFASMLSGRWPSEARADGSYFVDADGAIFEHILRFIRHSVRPLFYDSVKGHDFGLYAALLEQARFFGVEPLEKWLRDKTYLEAVQIKCNVEVANEVHMCGITVAGDVKVEYHPSWRVEKVYVCPRGILVHRGNRDACGRACRSARGDNDYEYDEEERLKIVMVRKKTIFMQDLCLEGSVK